MRTYFVFLALVGLVLIQSCKTAEPMTISHPDRIEYGSFGGFAGSYTEYKVVPDGHAWKQERLKGPVVDLAKMDADVIAQLTSIIKTQKEADYNINTPGNMTYFIRLCEEGQPPYELIWGGGEQVDARIKSIYKTLVKLSKVDHPTK